MSCRHINNSPNGQVTAGAEGTSAAQSQSSSSIPALVDVVAVSVSAPGKSTSSTARPDPGTAKSGNLIPVPDPELRAASSSMHPWRECNNSWVLAYGPIRFSLTAEERRERTCRKRCRWRERSVYVQHERMQCTTRRIREDVD